jgi:hypothetical protein
VCPFAAFAAARRLMLGTGDFTGRSSVMVTGQV